MKSDTGEQRRRLEPIMPKANSNSGCSEVQEALIDGYQHLVPAMQCDVKDRHVAAAAVHAGAQLVVTENLRDFRNLPDGLKAKSAGAFLLDLYDLNPEAMTGIVISQAASLKRPPRRIDDVLRVLRKLAPDFVDAVQADINDRRS